ncbi:MAG: hypothetical protein EZS28_037598 [Streblomastix strix]|uniref:Uncharacterized protein n=1 Tax=Streblomastix strix TaxID=222440 RepID=A0A5J4U8K2_9EUKA|nr:MAG: hypothetical protein EZS28_037598 [Streblomastix strix]
MLDCQLVRNRALVSIAFAQIQSLCQKKQDQYQPVIGKEQNLKQMSDKIIMLKKKKNKLMMQDYWSFIAPCQMHNDQNTGPAPYRTQEKLKTGNGN